MEARDSPGSYASESPASTQLWLNEKVLMGPNTSTAKVAVVTGGCGAIGAAIASELRIAGVNAIALDVAPPLDPKLPWVKCDVRDDQSVAQAVRQIADQHGGIDISVHAAGISRDAVVWKLAVDDWDAVQSVNLRGAFLLIRHALPLMRRRGEGRIVLIGSINGSRGKFGTAA